MKRIEIEITDNCYDSIMTLNEHVIGAPLCMLVKAVRTGKIIEDDQQTDDDKSEQIK